MPALRRSRLVAVAAAAFVAGSTISLAGLAGAAGGGHGDVPPANPTSADQIQNIDQVKTAIKAYYGDRTTSVADPSDPSKTLHEPSPDSAWAKEVRGISNKIKLYLDCNAPSGKSGGKAKKKALVLDVDDTSLVTYDYEISSSFVYNPTTNGKFVDAAVFPPVESMPSVAKYAEKHGYQVIWLTGRPESQRAGTVKNLGRVGYDAPDTAHLYLKDQSAPWLASCAPSCTTIQYKSLTRKHIESQGYDIVANVGDQYSDLKGGHADRGFKLPNPMYYLP